MPITMDQPFNTAPFFSGGAGMFIQYHDIIKPVWLYAVVKMIITGESFGLPISIIKNMSIASLLEWYQNRKYQSPLQQLDWNHKATKSQLDDMMQSLLQDDSLYRLSPLLNVDRLFHVYRQQHMVFPVYVYTPQEEPGVAKDCSQFMQGIHYTYLHGDLKSCIQKCDQNFTYIFSDIELLKESCDILLGTCSHLLLATDYRYNYTDNFVTTKHDMTEMMRTHPFLRLGTTRAMDVSLMATSFENISQEVNRLQSSRSHKEDNAG